MNESDVKKLYRDLGIPYKSSDEFDKNNEFDFFPKYGHVAWKTLKV